MPNVLIVGAGICGLACGAALRPFAKVTILESVKVVREIGAAVHLAPNATRIIKNMGGNFAKYGAVNVKAYKTFHGDGRPVIDAVVPTDEGENQWFLNHRVDVLQELQELATSPNRPGKPCEVILNTRVTECDPEAGSVTTTTGEVYKADVVLVCDGIRSACRPSIIGDGVTSVASGHSAYRMLVPAAKIKADPELEALGVLRPQITGIYGGERRIICYPCRDSTILNFVCCLPDSELNEMSEEKWTAKGDVNSLVKSFETFDPVYQKLLATGEDIGLWQLRDQDPLEKWAKGRAILLGDAAHAMLPHQGQGASQAIEDAEAVGAMLQGVAPSDIPQALERIFRVRYKRATRTQEMSRAAGLGSMSRKLAKTADGATPEAQARDTVKFQDYTWSYRGALDWEKNRPEEILPA